jgi:PAS domain S-box-containing protein
MAQDTQLQEKLKQSEQRYRNFFRTSRDALFITTREGHWLDMNDAMVELLGYSSTEELRKVNVSALYADPQQREEHLRLIIEEGFVKEHAVKLVRKDGRVIETLITSVPVEDESGNVIGFQGTIRDVTALKLAEQQEQELRVFWQRTLDSLKNHIAITDEKGIITAVNKAWRDFADRNGLEWQEHGLGTNYLQIAEEASGGSTEKAKETARGIEDLLGGKVGFFELEYPCHSPDKRRWFRLTGTRFVCRGGVRLVLSHEDITSRKLSEEALEYRLHFEELVSRLSNEFINVSLDLIDRRINNALADLGRFVNAGRAYVFQFDEQLQFMSNTHEWCAPGISAQRTDAGSISCVSVPWWMSKLNQFQPIYVPSVADLPPEAEAEKGIFSFRGTKSVIAVPLVYQNRLTGFIGLEAVRQPASWSGDTVYLLQTAGEIFVNALKHREDKLTIQKSEQRYRKIFELSPEAIVLLDINARVIQVNDRLNDWLGYKPEEIIGKDLWELPYLPEESKRIIAEQFARRMAGHGGEPYELDFLTRQGVKRVGLIHATPLTDTHGRVIADLVLISDITDRKRSEQELQETNQQLEDALQALRETQQQMVNQERRRVLTTMASGIAHDFNNALMPIHGYTSLLLEDPEMLEDRDETIRCLQNIYKASNNAANTIRRLRKFYRPREEDSFSAVDLNKVISEAVSVTKPRWKEEAKASGRDIQVRTEPGDIPPVYGNDAELDEILTNLIFNAVDAMPGGGEIRIRTHRTNNEVMLEFSDTGKGMPEEVRQKCMDPFYTTKGSGSGLGLATTQGIVERHNGVITIHSEEGKGTSFHIALPAADSEHERDLSKEKKEQNKPRLLRLLVVEDEETQRRLLRDLLQRDGHTVALAATGEEALEQFDAEKYDAVITDRAMPGMNGDKLAVQIKKVASSMPVMMLTGFGDIMDAAEDKPDAVDRVVTKPVTLDKLRNSLANLDFA